ncbi:hypothetical protein FQN53_007043, partial [Emmonsiellopsis sp. PD_33]
MSSSEFSSLPAGRRFLWPEIQLNIWILVVLAGSASCLGIFGWFMVVQTQMELRTPWVFPFMVAVAALSLIFLFLIIYLALQRTLIPEIIIVGSFILSVLWLTGLIGTSIQLYGSAANVNSNCQNYVSNFQYKGPSIQTLAWLTNMTVCNCWKAAFAFEVIITVFFLWMLVMAFD